MGLDGGGLGEGAGVSYVARGYVKIVGSSCEMENTLDFGELGRDLYVV